MRYRLTAYARCAVKIRNSLKPAITTRFISRPALDGAGIRYRRHGTRGSGVIASIGELAELYRYYVMFPDYGAARAVVPDTDFGEMSEEELLEYMEEYSESDGCPEDCDASDGSEE